MAHDVFISYSSKDKPVADAVCAGLESRGIRCWVAPRDILPGADWGAAIIDAITGSRVMVLIFSGNANTSQQIKREVERAVAKGVRLVPFRIEDVPMSKSLEYFISTPHWLDALSQPLEGHIAKLSDTVTLLLSSRETPRLSGRPVIPVVKPAAPARLPGPQPSGSRPPRSSRGMLVAVAAVAVLAWLGYSLLHRGGPKITGVNFPTSISASGRDYSGEIQFEKGRGEITQASLSVVEGSGVRAISTVPRGVGSQEKGSVPILIRTNTPQQVTIQATLVDAQGRRSNAKSFTFMAEKAAANQRPIQFNFNGPVPPIRLPH